MCKLLSRKSWVLISDHIGFFGACNPQMAYQALQAEDRIGTMLPCNVIVQQREGGLVEVSAVDPVASMMAVKNSKLLEAATKVREMLRQVVEEVGAIGRVEAPSA